MRFKYKYEDLHCGFCNEIEPNGCPHQHCPHILENISDLLHDPEFIEAVDDADICESYHRPTLLLINEVMDNAAGYDDDEFDVEVFSPHIEVICTFKPECKGCPYPRHGDFCYDEKSGLCLKDYVNAMNSRSSEYDSH